MGDNVDKTNHQEVVFSVNPPLHQLMINNKFSLSIYLLGYQSGLEEDFAVENYQLFSMLVAVYFVLIQRTDINIPPAVISSVQWSAGFD